MSKPLDDFAKRLVEARAVLGMTQAEIAKLAGMDGAHVSHFESGRRKPSMRNLLALADALGVSTDWLLGRVEKPTDKLPPRIFRTLNEMIDRLQQSYD